MKSSIPSSAVRTLFMLAIMPALVLASGTPRWQYSGEYGPEHWGRMNPGYALCDHGKRQSPINIVETKKEKQPGIRFQYEDALLRIVNNGHTIRMNITNGSRIIVGGTTYKLLQFHFHTPSGDQIQGKEYEMAAHLVHRSDAGQLAVIVVLFAAGKENPALTPIWSRMPAKQGKEQLFFKTRFNPGQLMPAEKGYYQYPGSLTVPPCTEGVRWFVLRQPVEVSAEQLGRFKAIFPRNNRPVQPLNDRVVVESS